MAQEDEKILVEGEGQAEGEASRSEKGEDTAERKGNPEAKVKREVKKVVARLKEHVETKLREQGKQVDELSHDEFRAGLEQLTLEEIESYLREIRDVASKVKPEERRELLQQEEEVRAIEQDVVRRRVEGTDIAKELTLEAQVFGNFERFLGTEGVTIQTVPGTQEIEVTTTNDGQKIVKVPEPSLENMIQVARQLNLGEFSPETTANLRQFAEELQLAAVMLDDRVFGMEAVAVLYNAGYQIDQLIQDPSTQDIKKIDDINELSSIIHDSKWQGAVKNTAQTNKVFLDLFMGQHDLADTTKRTFYNTYFKRWQEQKIFREVVSQDDLYKSLENQLEQTSDKEKGDQLRQQLLERRGTLMRDGLDNYAKNTPLAVRQQEYNAWLSDPAHQTEVFSLMRRFIEKSLKSGEKGTQAIKEQVMPQELYGKMLDPWNFLVRNAEGKFDKTPEGAKGYFEERLKRKLPEAVEELGLVHVLNIINDEFNPQNEAEGLDYVPAHLIKKFSAKDSAGERDAAACIIAIAYEKKVLEQALGDQYLVLPEINGNHATLLVIDAQAQLAYRLDPSIPQNPQGEGVVPVERDDPFVASIYEQLSDFYGDIEVVEGGDILDEEGDVIHDLRNIRMPDKSPQELEIFLQSEENGVKRIVASGDRLISSVLLSNMAALGDNTYFQAANAEDLHQMQLDAVESALRIVPQNNIAQKVKEALLKRAPANEIVTPKRQPKAPLILFPEARLGKENLVGYWKDPATVPAWLPNEVKNTIRTVNDALGATRDLGQLPLPILENAANLMSKWQQQFAGDNRVYDYVTERMLELNQEYAQRSSGREDTIFSGSLSPREQQIFLQPATDENIANMNKFLSRLVYNFGSEFDPGFALPPNATSILQGKLDDIQRTIQVNPHLASSPKLKLVQTNAEKNSRLLYAVQAAYQTEQVTPDSLKQAFGTLSNMDDEGGHGVASLLSEMHEGRPHMIADEYGRKMEQIRQEKKRLGHLDGAVITPNEYKQIRRDIIEEQMRLAWELGIGRYVNSIEDAEAEVKENYKHLHPNPDPVAAEAAASAYVAVGGQGRGEVQEVLRKYITADTNFASTLFIIDGRASSYLIREDDPGVYDGTSPAGVDQEYKDHVRYDQMTEARKQLLRILETSRAEFYIELRWGKAVLKDMKKRGVLDQFVRLNNIELIAPQTDKYWEGQFIRIRPMLRSIKKWREQHGLPGLSTDPEAQDDRPETQYALGLRTLWGGAHDQLVSGERPGIDTSDPLLLKMYLKYVGDGGEKAGGRAQWTADRQNAYKQKSVRYGMMMEYMSQFYQDELIKPFAYEYDVWTDTKGNRLDPRFEAFFTGSHTAFLDKFGLDPNLPLAKARFKVFQDTFGSVMAGIRSYNINGIDPNLPPERRREIEQDPTGAGRREPLQTAFGRDVYSDITRLGQGVAGLNGRDVGVLFRDMMAEMTQVLTRQDNRGHNMGINNLEGPTNNLIGRLAYDPLMDHAIRQSPLTIADVPYWMLHGKDPYGKDHPLSVQVLFGGNNQFGRWYSDQPTLSKGRVDLLKLVSEGNPNQLDETMLKVLNEGVMAANKGYKGLTVAAEVLGSVGGKLMELKIAHGAELIGAERTVFLGMSGKSGMRKLFGKRSEGWAQEDAKMRYWTQFDSALVASVYREMTRRLIEGKKLKRLGRSLFKILFSILLLTVLESMTTATQAFQAELQQG